ncbi:hypothetical protein [Pleionea sediminis]|uniref:sulfotransferase-like domain-containing protein n=1 Tax=Pleionea sediminis TaxID=2569479 RepID=UPI001184B1CB|nr:hypothetical protein [Pleionea sediminis]
MTKRIAMWSGPRNISTAMMRSWENRPDCSVVDEPFYACYLKETGFNHPGFQEIIESQSTSWREVQQQLTEVDVESPIFYQKHMTHHMLRGNSMDWAKSLAHVFLIRNPHAVVASYVRSRPTVNQDDIGVLRQFELYEELCELTEQKIPIIESDDVLNHPQQMLSQLCTHLSIPFDQQMLQWPSGKRDSDGVWAPYWYASVEQSTHFKRTSQKEIKLTTEQQRIAEEAMPAYLAMFEKRLLLEGRVV